MREIMALLQVCKDESFENIAIARGKYEYTGKIIADTKKIIRNGRRENSN